MSDSEITNVFEAIARVGHDEDFAPRPVTYPAKFPAGKARVQVYAARVRRGEEVFSPKDYERE